MKKRMKMIRSIAAYHKSTQGEILDIIGPDLYWKMRNEQPGGMFKSYVLAHEGVSTVSDIKSNSVIDVTWEKKALIAAYPKVDISGRIKFLNKHDFEALKASDNSKRDKIGSLVGKAQRIIEGKESIVIVGHFPRESKEIADNSDSISMESDWLLEERNGTIYAKGIDNIEAIALASSKDGEKSGFPGAKEITKIAAYPKENTQMAENQTQAPGNGFTGGRTFKDLEQDARDMNLRITQLHSPRDIIGQRKVSDNGSVFYDGRDKVQDKELQNFIENDIVSPFVKNEIILKKEAEEAKKEATEAKKALSVYKAVPKLEEYAKQNKLPGYVLKMALKQKDKMEVGDDLDKSVKEHFETTQKAIKDLEDAGAVFTDKPTVPDDKKDKTLVLPDGDQEGDDIDWGDE
jgi:hypothetical protein